MEKSSLHIFRKFLPLVVALFFILTPTDASATVSEFFKEAVNFVFDAVADAAARQIALVLDFVIGGACNPPQATSSNSLFGPMFETLFNASASVASLSYKAFHSDLGRIVLVFLAVVIALNILKNLATMGARDAGSILNDLFSRAFVCAAIYIIITQSYYNILNMTIVPILEDGLSFVQSDGGTGAAPAPTTYNLSGSVSSAGAGDGDTGEVMPKRIGQIIIASIESIERQIRVLFNYAEWAWCLGTVQERIAYFIPNPIFLIDAVLLFVAGLFFMAAYPWVLADAVLQLGISLAFLPFAVVGYAFGPTKKYLPKLFSWILNSLFVFIFMSIVITCILTYISGLFLHIFNITMDPLAFFSDPNGLAFYGPNMIKLLFILIIGWTYMPMVRDLAKKFAEGAGLSAAGDVGKSMVSSPIENYTGKAADWATSAAGNATLSSVNALGSGARRASGHITRGTIRAAVNRFGSSDPLGNKTLSIAGMTFATHKNSKGETIVLRGHNSYTKSAINTARNWFNTMVLGKAPENYNPGRSYATVSDRYSTIRYVSDDHGNIISSEVEFKHNFANKYLFNENGEVNMGALKTLLDSSLGQDPEYRKAILAQVALEGAKKRGFHVSSYYNKREITFDPNDPYSISIKQIDHSGSVTDFSLQIDEQTGRTAIGYRAKVTKTAPMHKLERKTKIKMHDLFIKAAGHYTEDGNMAFDTWFKTHYETRVDPETGEEYYIRCRKKFLFFGDEEVKEFRKDGTRRHIRASAQTKEKNDKKIVEIISKLEGKAERKTLFYKYGSYIDDKGNVVYTQNVRAWCNVKNYLRVVKGAVPFAANLAISPIKATVLAVAFPLTAIQNIRHPKRFLNNVWHDVSSDWKKHFSGAIQTGNVEHFSSSGKVERDSLTGKETSVKLNDYVTEKNILGQESIRDKLTGAETTRGDPIEYNQVVYFNNGAVEIKTVGSVNSNGKIISEKTTFKYSDSVQKNHSSVVSSDDSSKPVSSSGVIAQDLQATLPDGSLNPNSLMFGMDKGFANLKTIGKIKTEDFFTNILATGSALKTNRMTTDFLNKMSSEDVEEEQDLIEDDDKEKLEEEKDKEQENNELDASEDDKNNEDANNGEASNSVDPANDELNQNEHPGAVNLVDTDGNTIGYVLNGVAYSPSGGIIGFADPSGNIVNFEGKIIGKV